MLVPEVQPGDLKITHKHPVSVEVSWTSIPIEQQNGYIIGYTLQVVGPNSNCIHEILVEGEDANSIGISNLKPFTLYTFKVSAKTKAGSGPAASISSKTPEGSEI